MHLLAERFDFWGGGGDRNFLKGGIQDPSNKENNVASQLPNSFSIFTSLYLL